MNTLAADLVEKAESSLGLSSESSLGLQPFDLQDQLGLSIWGEMRFVSWVLTRVNLDPSSCPAQAPANLTNKSSTACYLLYPSSWKTPSLLSLFLLPALYLTEVGCY